LKSKYKISWFEESGSLFQIQFLIMKDKVSIMIDTSGVGLHKRGYREISAQAPIKETLAAAMVELSRVRKFHTVIDPFCGSGTILIESAMKAMNIAPGLNRTFAAQKFGVIPQNAWQQEFEKARSNIITDCEFQAFGYDIDESTLQIARENAKKANVSGKVVFAKRDIRDFAHETEKGTVICNPPYGERLLDVKSAEELYKVMGEKFIQKSGWSYAIISPDSEFEQIFGRKADKRRKLYNGMIPCQVYMYFK
ncbi:MAG: methyltransferase, partial [Bacillota bacterium]|nr:methyltransferase [Bacillota bacterium]